MRGYEFSNMSGGQQFEYSAVKHPHPNVMLKPEEKERICRGDNALRHRLQAELLGKERTYETLGEKGIREALQNAIAQRQSLSGVFIEDRFAHPATRFGKILYETFRDQLSKTGRTIKISVNSSLGTLLDVEGIDAFVRMIELDAESMPRAKSDITIDFTTMTKSDTAARVLILGTPESFSTEEVARKVARDVFSAAMKILRNKDRDDVHVVMAPDVEIDYTNE